MSQNNKHRRSGPSSGSAGQTNHSISEQHGGGMESSDPSHPLPRRKSRSKSAHSHKSHTSSHKSSDKVMDSLAQVKPKPAMVEPARAAASGSGIQEARKHPRRGTGSRWYSSTSKGSMMNAIVIFIIVFVIILVIVGLVIGLRRKGRNKTTTTNLPGLTPPSICPGKIPPTDLSEPKIVGEFCKDCVTFSGFLVEPTCDNICCLSYYPNRSAYGWLDCYHTCIGS